MPAFLQWIIVILAIAAAVYFLWRMLRTDNSACSGCGLKEVCSKKGRKPGKDGDCRR